MELILVRHAESLFNTRESKHLDAQLSKRGVRQCQEVANYLSKKLENEWHGFVSPYFRTLATANAIRKETGIEFDIDWRIREFSNGAGYTRNTHFDVEFRPELFPEIFRDMENPNWVATFETGEDLIDRLLDFWCELKEKDGKYIMVSHAMPIYTMYNLINGTHTIPKWDKKILNTSVTHFIDEECNYFAKFVNSGVDPRSGKNPREDLVVF
jgi:broad specificity phosphatase PhoE